MRIGLIIRLGSDVIFAIILVALSVSALMLNASPALATENYEKHKRCDDLVHESNQISSVDVALNPEWARSQTANILRQMEDIGCDKLPPLTEADDPKAAEAAAAARKEASRPGTPLWDMAVDYEHTANFDPVKAANLYADSCRAREYYQWDNGEKNLMSCISFIEYLRHDNRIKGEPGQSAGVAELMCNQKSYAGCVILAEMLYNGEGIPQDKARAATLFQMSCDNGYAKGIGCAALGRMYEEGGVVTQDLEKAARYYESSCNSYQPKSSSAYGCYKKGMLNLLKSKNKKDRLSIYGAFDAFDVGCNLGKSGIDGSAASCFQEALLVSKGTPYKKNGEHAISMLRHALKYDPAYAPALNQLKQWGAKVTCTAKEKSEDMHLNYSCF